MRCGILQDAVRPDNHCKEIIEAKGRRYIEPVIRFEANANGVNH